MNKQEIVELIKEKRDKAQKEIDNEIAPQSYGAGMEWGAKNVCDEILEEIRNN